MKRKIEKFLAQKQVAKPFFVPERMTVIFGVHCPPFKLGDHSETRRKLAHERRRPLRLSRRPRRRLAGLSFFNYLL